MGIPGDWSQPYDCEIHVLIYTEFLGNACKTVFPFEKLEPIIDINVATLLLREICLIRARKARVSNEIILRSITSFSLS